MAILAFFSKIVGKKFGGIAKKLYLCKCKMIPYRVICHRI